jgi:hypothetical protein
MKNVIPFTDARYRPDIRALEEGDFDRAKNEKHRVEEKQRAVRKQRERMGLEEANPVYFREIVDEFTGNKAFKFTGEYWKDRETQSWGKLPDIY